MAVDNEPTRLEPTVPKVTVTPALTNFQLVPDNGGYVLVLGTRRLKITDENFGAFPTPQAEVFATAFLSHAILADLARVLKVATDEFEKQWGHIPLPGVDKPLV